MGILDVFKTIGRGINKGLKATKIISTLAPVIGTALGNPAVGTGIGAFARSQGYAKGGRVQPRKGMKKGGRVTKSKSKPKKKKK